MEARGFAPQRGLRAKPLVRQIHKNLSRNFINRMHFKLVGLTSKDRYFLRKWNIERSETGSKPLSGVRDQGRSP